MGWYKHRKQAQQNRAASADVSADGKVTATELRAHSANQIRTLAKRHGIEYTNKPEAIAALVAKLN